MPAVTANEIFSQPGELPTGWVDVLEETNDWPTTRPCVMSFTAEASDVDQLGHVNNVSYLRWLEIAAWRHAEKLGVGWSVYQQTGCAMVVHRHELDYRKPAMAGDELLLATWLASGDGRLRLERRYQLRREHDGVILLDGITQFICIDIASGKPKRMPPEFRQGYAEALAV